MRNITIIFAFLAILTCIFFSCKHDPDQIVNPDDQITCDSSSVTYPGTVYPLFEQYCIFCHSGTPPQGGIDLTNFNQVAILVMNGQLAGSINHAAGYSPMPKNSDKLPACELALIMKWINDTTLSDTTTNPCDPDTVYFYNDILPLLQSGCAISGCHDDITAQDGVILTNYNDIIQTGKVEPFDPGNSEIYEVMIDPDPDKRMPPPPRDPFTSVQIQMVLKWIQQGALENQCMSTDCDSINVTFSQTIWPVIQNSCLGCHSGTTPSGGVSLEGYDQVKAAGVNGSLLGTVSYAAGYSPMPKNGMKLSDCKIAQIRKWVNDGFPNN